jgi:cell division septal protein FtsQ
MDNLKLEDWGAIDDHTPEFLSKSTMSAMSDESSTHIGAESNLVHTQSMQAVDHRLLEPQDESSIQDDVQSTTTLSWLTIWIFLVFLINGLLVYDALGSLPYFKIKDIDFHNLKRLQKEELLKDLNFKSLYLNYFFVDIGSIEQHLKSHAWIKNVVIEREYPNRLQAFIQEKKAVAVSTLKQLTAIDEEGSPIAPISAKEAMSLPLISGVSYEFFAEGGDRHIGQRLLLRGLNIAQLYQRSELSQLRPLSEVYVSETGRIELMLQQTRVSLGTKNFDSSLHHLKRIIKHLKKRGLDASYILLSEDQTRAIVKEIPLKIETTP